MSIPKGSILEDVLWENVSAQSEFKNFFTKFKGKKFDELEFKITQDDISKELYASGFLNHKINAYSVEKDGKWYIRIQIQYNERTNFNFKGNNLFIGQNLKTQIHSKIKSDFGKIDIQAIERSIIEFYELNGYFGTLVSTRIQRGIDIDNNRVNNYHFSIIEGKKIKIKEIQFRGNNFFTVDDILSFYNEHASSLSSSGYYDKGYLEEFSSILAKEYLRNGFVFIDISKPRIVTNKNHEITIEYSISEKHQVLLDDIVLSRIPQSLKNGMISELTNTSGNPINVVEMENDLRKMIVYLQNQGYYFSTITNLTADNLLSYDSSYTTATLRPLVELGDKICFNDAVISGNIVTDSKVILRELNFENGQVITPSSLDNFRQTISSLNLFSSVKVTPYIVNAQNSSSDCLKTNLVVQLQEKDFGMLEIAPGFRTDLGAKISSAVTYNNINGKNGQASLRLQANRRFNLDGFDDRRKHENKDLVEFSARASYIEPYLFYDILKTQLEFEISTSYQRNRYYGFDADIFRFSPQVSKTFNKWLSTSVSYQFERIEQFDATELKDNDSFSIGGITPTITIDFRDDVINPRKGAFFTLSSEWANSNFGSMKNDDLEVNFVKVISRNRFYIPMGDFTFAISLAMGYQKNFATDLQYDFNGNPIINANGKPKTRGYIPSIKVFRLDGYDEIRGYDESEINRTIDGTPIGEMIVQGEAYFTAIKLEQRYHLTDNVRVGVFFDAGRVFVNEFEPAKLRTSIGAGLKFITPVGSLDFDYGFKLQKKEYGPSTRDSVGRFHLSIGYF